MKPEIKTIPNKVMGTTFGYKYSIKLPRFDALESKKVFVSEYQARLAANRWLERVKS